MDRCRTYLHLSTYEDGTDSVPKRRHIKFRPQGITQKKAYNIQNTAKVLNQEDYCVLALPKMSLPLTGFCSSNGVNFILNPVNFVNTEIRDKFNCIFSALAKVI